ncbi:MAG: addiction module antidote protein, HigA family [Rhodospirillales bacterium]|nr:MAG: addiction module antidote protein, HigA family [Rhodospirillales bacterium]
MTTALSSMHPGEFLREVVLPEAGVSKTQIAERLGLSRQSLHAILSERTPVTAKVALKLGRLFGNSPQFWLNLQAEYDVETLSQEMRKELKRIRPILPHAA